VTHASHAALSVLSCGLWVPFWILFALLGWITPTRCTVCGNVFRQRYYTWTVGGRKQYLCPHCNQTLERRQSRGAMRRRFR
jgi:hypothetical protein